MSSLKKQVSTATFWNLASNIATGFVRFISTAILAHYLTIQEFGVAGMAYIVYGFVAIFGCTGLSSALIYKKDPDNHYFSTVFWANFAMSIVLSFATCVIAYPASIFFKTPELFPILSVLSISFAIAGVSTIHYLKLQKEFRYKEIGSGFFLSNLLASIIALIMAYFKYGVWSIIMQTMLSSLFYTIWLFYVIHWYPNLIFDLKKFIELFKYGRNFLFEAILNFLTQNLDYFIIGRKLGGKQLGFYKMAFSIPHIVYDEFTKRITPVLFPLLCKVQDDSIAYKTAYLNAIKFNAIIIFPIIAAFIFLAEPFVLVIYGDQWKPIIPLARIIAVCSILRCVNIFATSMLSSKGRPDIGLKINLIRFPLVTLAILYATRFGIMGVACAVTLAEIIGFLVVHPISARVVRIIRCRDIYRALLPASTVALITYGVIYLISFFVSFKIHLFELIFYSAVSTLIIAVSYVTLFYSDLKELVSFVGQILKR